MKKRGFLLVCVLLAAGMLLVFCGCSSYRGVRAAFEKEGYEEADLSDDVKDLFEDGEEYKKISGIVTLHVLQKKGSGLLDAFAVVVIAEFNSTEEMEDALKDKVSDQDAKNVYDELQKLDVVSGNCFLLFYTPATKGLEIFKKTK